MHRFAVWAPRARVIDLVSDGRRIGMSPADGGWWESGDAAADAGTRYGFSIEGGPPRPDPRSPSQPDGVLGLSEVVDQTAYPWRDAGWRGRPLAGLVLYELHIGTFTAAGTFDSAIERLPQLVELGVDAVEVMPVAEFSGTRGWGYDGVHLFAPHHAYGGPEAMKRLVDACHLYGLAVILDVVYNHLGPVGNFLPGFGPYFSERHHTAWGAALNFDGPDAGEVRRFAVDNALMWIRDYHMDGLRLDAVHAIADESPTHILEQLATEVTTLGEELGRATFVIAESELNDPRIVRDRASGGYGLDAVWDDDWHHALHTVLTGEHAGYYKDFGSLAQLGKALRQAWVYDGVWSRHRGRPRGGKPDALPPHAFVVATQTHDQVGNRAAGERLAALVGIPQLKAAAALLLTSPFTPMVFQGEEWAASTPFLYFTSHEDPVLGRAVADGRKHEFEEFGWGPKEVPDPQDFATFERSQLRWEEVGEDLHAGMLDWYRDLIALRRRLPPAGARAGEGVDVMVDERARRVSFSRPGVSVDVNLGDDDWTVVPPAGSRLAMCSRHVATCDGGVSIPPLGTAIFETESPIG